MPRGKNADKRLKYIHTGPNGTTCVSPEYVVRVSLPEKTDQPRISVVYPQAVLDSLPSTSTQSNTPFEMPEGRPAVTGPEFLIPKFEQNIPKPDSQTATFTCNGELLSKMLKIACEVSNDSDKTMRLRLCDNGTLRIDNYREPGDQEFLGVLYGVEYFGNKIPGDKDESAPVKEERPKQKTEVLKTSNGRRFR